ncbi:hypothetical protein F5146DRAFT_1123307 [Armillaria mellea]|nr:hypothetical protein F5146DRAFT_1123307 [Armillaria mellea]
MRFSILQQAKALRFCRRLAVRILKARFDVRIDYHVTKLSIRFVRWAKYLSDGIDKGLKMRLMLHVHTVARRQYFYIFNFCTRMGTANAYQGGLSDLGIIKVCSLDTNSSCITTPNSCVVRSSSVKSQLIWPDGYLTARSWAPLGICMRPHPGLWCIQGAGKTTSPVHRLLWQHDNRMCGFPVYRRVQYQRAILPSLRLDVKAHVHHCILFVPF